MKQTVVTHNGFPRVGIRPIIDGRRRGVPAYGIYGHEVQNRDAIAYGHIGADYRACKNFGPLYATNR